MRKELRSLGIILGITVLSELAFSRPQRMRIGALQGWKCQEPKCTKRFQNGWLVDVHHKTPVWEGGQDVDSNGEVRCLEHHYTFHKNRGNGEDAKAARLILGRIQTTHGGRTRSWIHAQKKKR